MMNLVVDLDRQRLLDSNLVVLSAAALRYLDDAAINIQFRRAGAMIEPASVGLVFTLKTAGKFEENPALALVNAFAKTGTGIGALWTGIAPIYGAAIDALLAEDGDDSNDKASANAMLEVAYQIEGGGLQRLPWVACEIDNSLFRETDTPPPLPLPFGQAVIFLPTVTGLVGGTETDLDAMPTAGTPVPRVYLARIGGILQTWLLRAGTDAAVPGSIVRPVDYDGTTNAKVYEIQIDVGAVAAALAVETAARIAGTASSPGWSSTVVALVGDPTPSATSLDGTNGVTDASTIFTVNRLFSILTAAGLKWCVLKAGTQATDGLSYVRPANYAGGTFEYVFNIVG